MSNQVATAFEKAKWYWLDEHKYEFAICVYLILGQLQIFGSHIFLDILQLMVVSVIFISSVKDQGINFYPVSSQYVLYTIFGLISTLIAYLSHINTDLNFSIIVSFLKITVLIITIENLKQVSKQLSLKNILFGLLIINLPISFYLLMQIIGEVGLSSIFSNNWNFLGFHRNTIGLYFFLIFAYSATYYIISRNWIFLLLTIVSFLSLIVFNSRGTILLALLFGSATFVIRGGLRGLLKMKYILVYTILLIIIGSQWANLKNISLISRYVDTYKFLTNSPEEISETFLRLENFEYYSSKIVERPVFGYGIGSDKIFTKKSGHYRFESENSYLEVLHNQGGIGLLFFLLFIYTIYRQSHYFTRALLITVLIGSLVNNYITNPFILSLVVISYGFSTGNVRRLGTS